MREYPCCLCQTIIKLILLKLLTPPPDIKVTCLILIKVSKGAKIRNQYNQVLHLTQDTNGKMTNSQLDITNESQKVSPLMMVNIYNPYFKHMVGQIYLTKL